MVLHGDRLSVCSAHLSHHLFILYASCGESWKGEGRRRLGCEEVVGVREGWEVGRGEGQGEQSLVIPVVSLSPEESPH